MDKERGIEDMSGTKDACTKDAYGAEDACGKDAHGAEDACGRKDAPGAEDACGGKDTDGAEDVRGIEEVFSELEEILSRMQDPQVTLQDSFALYEKGVRDIRICDEMLDRIEKRMLMLNPDGSVQPFEEEAQDGVC